MAARDSRTIKSAQRVLEILEYFDQDRRYATVMDMSRTLAYPQSSTSELLRCLTRLGYLKYNRYRRTYSPTTRVALLGAWVNPSLFRGGPILSSIDDLANHTGETVVLSTSSNYEVQHLHVIHGHHDKAVEVHVGDTEGVLHSPQGRLILSSYQNDHIRSAVHRLNAEETDPNRQVRVAEIIAELTKLREAGWIIGQQPDGTGCITVMLPACRGLDRLAVSIFAPWETMSEHSQDWLEHALKVRDEISAHYGEADPQELESNVVPMAEPIKIASYRRHFG